MIMTLDLTFPIPSNKRIKKKIHIEYTNAIGELKILLENTCESASLTTDLWMAKMVEFSLPYAAYTLQLSINRVFQKTKVYIKRIKRLVHFFTSSPKQSECLDDAQKEF
ncbi:1325_t:CDS:2 [Funneliformis caledonium]|uniref:1325_t:CDS:1 n=1 Tax=Funneliformis caledonium TaxID=1117310 RepID=A0A9N9D9H8_9GLOM|nr:1325_t:CDS:2 [Funneliformis caledonium]